MASQVKLVEGHWVSKCSLCVDGEVKTKCPAAPAQGTGVGERNRSLKRHAKRFAEQHGPGVCDHVAASQGTAAAADDDADDEVLPPQGRPATANGGAPAASLPQVSIYSLSSQALHFQTLSGPFQSNMHYLHAMCCASPRSWPWTIARLHPARDKLHDFFASKSWSVTLRGYRVVCSSPGIAQMRMWVEAAAVMVQKALSLL